MTTTTTPKRLILHAHELRRYRETGSVLVVRVVEPQPPTWVIMGNADGLFPSPFGSPGDAVYVAEEWQTRYVPERNCTWVLAESGRHILMEVHGHSGFDDGDHPASEMPAWAARHHGRIETVAVERVQELSAIDWVAAGWPGSKPCHPDATPDFQRACIKVGVLGYEDGAGDWFVETWDTLNPGHPYASNPHVWCVAVNQQEAE